MPKSQVGPSNKGISANATRGALTRVIDLEGFAKGEIIGAGSGEKKKKKGEVLIYRERQGKTKVMV